VRRGRDGAHGGTATMDHRTRSVWERMVQVQSMSTKRARRRQTKSKGIQTRISECVLPREGGREKTRQILLEVQRRNFRPYNPDSDLNHVLQLFVRIGGTAQNGKRKKDRETGGERGEQRNSMGSYSACRSAKTKKGSPRGE